MGGEIGFHWETDENQYRLYFGETFLGWFDSLAEVKHEIKLRKENAQKADSYAEYWRKLADSGLYIRVQ